MKWTVLLASTTLRLQDKHCYRVAKTSSSSYPIYIYANPYMNPAFSGFPVLVEEVWLIVGAGLLFSSFFLPKVWGITMIYVTGKGTHTGYYLPLKSINLKNDKKTPQKNLMTLRSVGLRPPSLRFRIEDDNTVWMRAFFMISGKSDPLVIDKVLRGGAAAFV